MLVGGTIKCWWVEPLCVGGWNHYVLVGGTIKCWWVEPLSVGGWNQCVLVGGSNMCFKDILHISCKMTQINAPKSHTIHFDVVGHGTCFRCIKLVTSVASCPAVFLARPTTAPHRRGGGGRTHRVACHHLHHLHPAVGFQCFAVGFQCPAVGFQCPLDNTPLLLDVL